MIIRSYDDIVIRSYDDSFLRPVAVRQNVQVQSITTKACCRVRQARSFPWAPLAKKNYKYSRELQRPVAECGKCAHSPGRHLEKCPCTVVRSFPWAPFGKMSMYSRELQRPVAECGKCAHSLDSPIGKCPSTLELSKLAKSVLKLAT